jgi:hypothetical protein
VRIEAGMLLLPEVGNPVALLVQDRTGRQQGQAEDCQEKSVSERMEDQAGKRVFLTTIHGHTAWQ